MPISQSEFNALGVGSEVVVCRRHPSRFIRKGIVDKITKRTKQVYCSGVSYSFYTPTRIHGDKMANIFIATPEEVAEISKEIERNNLARKLNEALQTVGNMRSNTIHLELAAVSDAIEAAKQAAQNLEIFLAE